MGIEECAKSELAFLNRWIRVLEWVVLRRGMLYAFYDIFEEGNCLGITEKGLFFNIYIGYLCFQPYNINMLLAFIARIGI